MIVAAAAAAVAVAVVVVTAAVLVAVAWALPLQAKTGPQVMAWAIGTPCTPLTCYLCPPGSASSNSSNC